MTGRRTRTWENAHHRAVWEKGLGLSELRKGLISCPHTNAERMSMGDGAALLLAAGVHAADEGAGCLKRLEMIDEEGEMRDSKKLGGMGFDKSARP